MPPVTQHAVRIAAPAAAKTLSRVRKQFNTLVKKLEAERVRLALWRDEMPKLRALAKSELVPLIQTFDGHYRALFFLYDAAWSNKATTKKEREKLSDLICRTGMDLMQRGDDDAIVKEIFDKHSALQFTLNDMGEGAEFLRDMVSAATGIELDADADFSSPQAIFAAMQAKLDEAESEADMAAPHVDVKPVKLSAREVRHQAEELKLKQSVRDIFRKLASALHPDRETDPAERTRKTGLMQRVNVAYAANDLLGLLELQLEIAQIDQAGLDKMDESHIKQYNRILTGQIDEVESEIMGLEVSLALDMGLDLDQRRAPKAMMRDLRVEIGKMREDAQSIEADLVNFRDIKKLKAWLKGYQIQVDAPEFGAFW